MHVVAAQPVEMCHKRATQLRAILHIENVVHKLKIELALSWEPSAGVAPNLDFFIRHNLNSRLFWNSKGQRLNVRGDCSIHQATLAVESMKEESLKSVDCILVLALPCPYVGNLPNVHLPVGNDVAAGAREMAADAGADSVYRLPYIDRGFIQVTERVDADRLRQ